MKSCTLHALALVAASIVACRTGGGAPAGKASVAMDPGAKVAEVDGKPITYGDLSSDKDVGPKVRQAEVKALTDLYDKPSSTRPGRTIDLDAAGRTTSVSESASWTNAPWTVRGSATYRRFATSADSAWGARDVAGVLRAAERMLDRTGDPISRTLPRLVGSLTKHVRNARAVQRLEEQGLTPAEAASQLGLKPFPAQKLYASLGYSVTQRLPKYYSNGGDGLLLVKPL